MRYWGRGGRLWVGGRKEGCGLEAERKAVGWRQIGRLWVGGRKEGCGLEAERKA